MTKIQATQEQYSNLSRPEQLIVATLALAMEPMAKAKLLECLRRADIRALHGAAWMAESLSPVLDQLKTGGFVVEEASKGITCATEINRQAVHAALKYQAFEAVSAALVAMFPVLQSYGNEVYPRSYRFALSRLRIALLRGQSPQETQQWLAACLRLLEVRERHPFVELFGQPFDAALLRSLNPQMRDEVVAVLLQLSEHDPQDAPLLRAWLETDLQSRAERGSSLVLGAAEFWLLSGRLDRAEELTRKNPEPRARSLYAAVLLLRGDLNAALVEFEEALKALRKQISPRVYLSGIRGYLYVLALLRSEDPKLRKRADIVLQNVARGEWVRDDPFGYLRLLRLSQTPSQAAGQFGHVPATKPLSCLLQMLVFYWLGAQPTEAYAGALTRLQEKTHSLGFEFIAAQAAQLRAAWLQQPEQAQVAAAIRTECGFVDLVAWFAREEPWQRQLAALVKLKAPLPSAPTARDVRLVWNIVFEPTLNALYVEPREQKLDARGKWTKGRPLALQRLADPEQLEFADAQDKRVCATALMRTEEYYGRVTYTLDHRAAILALAGHPLVFWQETPTIRVEIVRGEPQLLIEDSGANIKLTMQPELTMTDDVILIVKETPTRLRVTEFSEEHRRIGAIVRDGLVVPKHAKQQVLDAIAAISSLVTVHSDVGGGAANVTQVPVDARLHVHLYPHNAGLKIQILVRPFSDGGPYFSPGAGAENVIAEVNGQPCQTRRMLAEERQAQANFVAACPALESGALMYGEWLIDDPSLALELLLQLHAQAEHIVIAWPEGEKFKLRGVADAKQFSLSIKRDNEWFVATGELKIAEDEVLNLRKLLELMQQSPGRFVALGGGEFVALTEEFRRRLAEVATFGDLHGNGVRTHPLAAFSLDELASEVATVDGDRHWKQHLKRLHELDRLDPQLPSTLQTELRDYQADGFRWLVRLAHWGVGACLADDMGLGKTVQTLALILARAPQGATLIIAPTSVCTNWIAEATRFAPTLKLVLYGASNREKALTNVQPFDVVVASYGMLQNAADLFATVHWHTIVLDEAQAIKNRETKRAQAAMALVADFKVIVTGTPLENHLGELWSLFRFINPGLLGSLEQFNQRFAVPIERFSDAGVRARLRKLIQPFILRRTKNQVLTELPSRTEILRPVELSGEEMALYEALRREALDRLAAIDAPAGQKQIQILAEITKLRRACCHPQLVAPQLKLSGSKLAAFGELLAELLDNRHKALVFSQFVDHLSLIRAHLDERGLRYQYLDGATSMQERKRRVDAFQAGSGDVFLISLKAGGTGLNLTAADYVIHMDPWWNPAVEDQASDRAHRMGQQRPVTIYRLVAKHTIEEKIVELHQHKRDLADSLLGGGDVSGKMSADEILKLLQEEFRE